jgi:hypothetical protein
MAGMMGHKYGARTRSMSAFWGDRRPAWGDPARRFTGAGFAHRWYVHWFSATNSDPMNNPLRGLLAGAAAYKWGGGCFGTVIVFLLVYWLLGSC